MLRPPSEYDRGCVNHNGIQNPLPLLSYRTATGFPLMRPVNVYLVRHGETEENKTGIIQGQLDTRLNETGRGQAQILAEALKDVPFSHAFTSDLSRAADVGASVDRCPNTLRRLIIAVFLDCADSYAVPPISRAYRNPGSSRTSMCFTN